MAKRKEYIVAAEKAMIIVLQAYLEEHGELPGSYSVLKAALTRAYNKSYSTIYAETSKKLGCDYYTAVRHPDFKEAMKETVKELKELKSV